MKTKSAALLAAAWLCATSAWAAPKIENVIVKPNAKTPEIEVSVSVSRGRFDTGGCDARVEFGDGQGRNLDFGVAATRTVRHVYKKGGSYTVVARGAGGTPCEGSRQAPVTLAATPEPAKKAEPKKTEPEKKAEAKKKAPAKKAPTKKAPTKKKAEPKKNAPAKKAPAKKDEKKAEPK